MLEMRDTCEACGVALPNDGAHADLQFRMHVLPDVRRLNARRMPELWRRTRGSPAPIVLTRRRRTAVLASLLGVAAGTSSRGRPCSRFAG